MHTNLRATGASFVAQPSEHNARDLAQKVLEEKPEATSEDQFEEFCRRKKDSERLQRTIDWYFWVNMRSYFTGSRAGSARSPETRDAREVASRAMVADLKQKIARVVLFDLLLPNGKLLRAATFADCGKAGGWFSKLAKKGKPSQIVGKVLTEADLQKIR